MAKIVVKNGEISSSAGINIPSGLNISGNVVIGDNFTDTLIVNASTTFNDDIIVSDTVSASIGRFDSITLGSSISGSGAALYNITASGITNFTNDVRAQFSAGANITIANGLISSTGGGTGSSSDLGLVKNVAFITGSTTLTNDNHIVLVNCTAQSVIITLPAASSAGIRNYVIKKIDSTNNIVTISGSNNNEKIDGNSSIIIYVEHESYILVSDATSSWYII